MQLWDVAQSQILLKYIVLAIKHVILNHFPSKLVEIVCIYKGYHGAVRTDLNQFGSKQFLYLKMPELQLTVRFFVVQSSLVTIFLQLPQLDLQILSVMSKGDAKAAQKQCRAAWQHVLITIVLSVRVRVLPIPVPTMEMTSRLRFKIALTTWSCQRQGRSLNANCVQARILERGGVFEVHWHADPWGQCWISQFSTVSTEHSSIKKISSHCHLHKLISFADVTISHCLQMFCARHSGVVEGNKVVSFFSE